VQVQKLQHGKVRLQEQCQDAEQRLRTAHASDLASKDSDIRKLRERCENTAKEFEAHRTEAAAKV
jgi:hypothetical protein